MDSSFVVNIMKVASDFTRSARESFISSFNSLRVSKSVSHLLVKDILSCIRCASRRSNRGTIRSRYPAPATMPTIVNVVSKSFNSNCQVQMRYAPPYSVLMTRYGLKMVLVGVSATIPCKFEPFKRQLLTS